MEAGRHRQPPQARLETRAVHAGTSVDSQTGAVVEPITLSSTFQRDTDGGFRRGFHYSKAGNPNRRSLEQALATLEGGADAVAYSSGSAAILAVLKTVGPGSHVLVPDDVYQGTVRLLRLSLARWGVRSSAVDPATPTSPAGSWWPARACWTSCGRCSGSRARCPDRSTAG